MKAFILAAGFGTRLLPYTQYIPKPLFPIDGRPLLDIIIRRLEAAGCSGILINTHHLHSKIERFIAGQRYDIPVNTRYEPEILETGGALRNAADFWNDAPVMVINGDILTDIDLKSVYDFHRHHTCPVSMVMHDCPEFNTVGVDSHDFITAFGQSRSPSAGNAFRPLAFTGIHVLDPTVLDFIPAETVVGIIDIYREMISQGMPIKAMISEGHYWQDIGTPQKYREAVWNAMVPQAFDSAFPQTDRKAFDTVRLKGDGSDRTWYRICADNHSLIMVDHGIRRNDAVCEADSFAAIGRHLHQRKLPVPEIFRADTFSGMVLMEDLGDLHLQTAVKAAGDAEVVFERYCSVIDLLIELSISGAVGFQSSWTFQTPEYSRELILEKECRYFVDAFLNGCLGLKAAYDDLHPEFSVLADNALKNAVTGFMHRDFQSRNIMVKDSRLYLIDFQGGRRGPIQYDLASLLIDPYVDLPRSLQERLLDYCIRSLSARIPVSPGRFRNGYTHCALTRNLQMLGAFGYLTTVKGKTQFRQYIPAAVQSLQSRLGSLTGNPYPLLKTIADSISVESD